MFRSDLQNKVVLYRDCRAGFIDSSSIVLFVFSHEIERFIEQVQPLLTWSVVLVLHNSDAIVDQDVLSRLSPHVRHVFAQNLTAPSNVRHISVPIGIANSPYTHGDRNRVDFTSRFATFPEWKKDMCYFGFHVETNVPRRKLCKDTLDTSSWLTWQSPNKPFQPYLFDLLRHKYAVCPEGNGVDTHRFWECLYLGVVPIVCPTQSSVEFRSFLTNWPLEDMPVLVVSSWSDLSLTLLSELHPELWRRFTVPSALAKWNNLLDLNYYVSSIDAAKQCCRSSIGAAAWNECEGLRSDNPGA